MPRPSKLTPDVAKRITDALSAGNTRRAAAAYGGVDETTLCRWLRRSAGFASSVTLAEASCEVAAVATIRRAAATDWKASAWWLAHCSVTAPGAGPFEWGRGRPLQRLC